MSTVHQPQLTLLSGGPSQGRRENDAYFTDPRDAAALVRTLPIRPGDTCLEQCVGAGGWVGPMRAAGASRVDGCDINPDATGLRMCDRTWAGDFLELAVTAELGSWDWSIGNPPYARETGRLNDEGEPIMEAIAAEHVRKALLVADNVAFLLRLAILEGEERSDILDGPLATPWHVTVLKKRVQFMGGGKSNPHAMAFVHWKNGWTGPTTMSRL
jgi:hypothetical protein